ncbi:MAG: hypothetical protein K1X72_21790 [Pyrinomonadaceae bacterium]|nr:hypothetical protein [Pyrinomonadaceae bacterium]
MKKIIFGIIFVSIISLPVFAQKLKMEASGYYQKKDYCKMVETIEKSIAANETQDNYSYYYAAQSACQCGNQTEKAVDFYKKGFAISMDWSAYDFFANDNLNNCFNQTDDWKKALAQMKEQKDAYELKLQTHLDNLSDKTKKVNESPLTDKSFLEKLAAKDVKNLLKNLPNFNDFPNAPVTDHWALYNYKISETQEIPYLVYIPKNYNPKQKTPLYIFLHGAVGRISLAVKDIELTTHEGSFFEQPIKQNAFIIYPMANKNLNWLYHQKAFEMIIGELRQVKSLYNIDDDRVYIGGHSNGGSGAFWFALNMPTEIAAFSGFNFNPICYFCNTTFSNLKNNYTFFGVSGTEDSIFGYKPINELAEKLKTQGINWTNYGLKGNHDLPYKNPNDIKFLYDTLQKQTRNPFPKKLQWETDSAQNGRIYWLEISQLDTSKMKESWHVSPEPSAVNFTSSFAPDTKQTDFYPRKSGAVMAEIDNNVVKIKASCVKELTFYVVPQLVNLNKPLKIYVNDKLFFNSKVKADKNVLLEEFIKTKDRSFLVLNKINLKLD